MKQVADKSGNIIPGIFKTENGNLVVINDTAFLKNKLQHENFASLNKEVNMLKEQIKLILEKLNG